jgi:hypothetical protein
MKVKKTISQNVIAANRRNAQRSTGPKNVSAVRHNATKHGLLTKRIAFLNDEEVVEFEKLLAGVEEDFTPQGAIQGMLVEEIAVTWWKLGIALGWELEDVANRRQASRELLRMFLQNSQDQKLSSLAFGDGSPAAFSVWECQGALLKASSRNHEEDLLSAETDKKIGSSELELRIVSKLETILRYQTSLKRDLYRAIHTLHILRDERSAGDALPGLKAVRGR